MTRATIEAHNIFFPCARRCFSIRELKTRLPKTDFKRRIQLSLLLSDDNALHGMTKKNPIHRPRYTIPDSHAKRWGLDFRRFWNKEEPGGHLKSTISDEK